MPTVSNRGTNLVASFEGFRSKPYRDAVGVWTIGFGETLGVTGGTKPITRARALAQLRTRLNRDFGDVVARLVKVRLNQNEFDALTSLAYNIGTGAFGNSTLLKLLNQGKRQAAADQFLAWDKAGGRALAGLTRRRKAERALFLSKPVSHKVLVWSHELAALRAAAKKHGWTRVSRAKANEIKADLVHAGVAKP